MATLTLGDKLAYLSLHHEIPSCARKVLIHSSMQSVLSVWTSTTRISPICGVKEFGTDTPQDYDFKKETSLVFLGPVHPVYLSETLEANDKLWATFGLFNCVVAPENSTRLAQILAFAKNRSFRYEAWEIKDGEIINTISSGPFLPPIDWNKELFELIEKKYHPELDELLREYCPLMATALARSYGVVDSVYQDLCQANKLIISSLNLLDIDEESLYRVQGRLTTLNSALSRLTSQFFSGSIPISATECHFWSHSLLGTGIANLALSNITSSIRSRLGTMRIPKRLELLGDTSFTPPPATPTPSTIYNTEQNHNFWDGGLLLNVVLKPEHQLEPIFPQITFFSGRDGFRATLTTLSAPLATVTSCNSMRWSLMTISHEISHIMVRAILGKLLPVPNDKKQLELAAKIILEEPGNYLDAAKKLLLHAILGLHNTEVDPIGSASKRPLSISHIKCAIETWHTEVEEILVHVFDYSFFFDNIDDYLSSIWLSWSVIPNISSRVPEYVLRSLCAALTDHLRRTDDLDHAKAEVVRILTKLRDSGQGGLYVDEALHLLDTSWASKYKVLLEHRRRLVKFSRGFLCWPGAASALRKEKWVTSGESDSHGYAHKRRILSDIPLNNPLRFAKEYTHGVTPNVSESLWLLLTAAFNYDHSS